MSDEIRLSAAFVLALMITALTTPWARRLALRIDLLDHPGGYKEHARATPYLGGAAVVAGALGSAVAFGDGLGEYAPVTACVFILCCVGILDDRVGLGVSVRLAVQIAAGISLWGLGLGWDLVEFGGLNLAFTVLWTVGVTNALNLMDNLDGAAGSVAATSAVGVAVLTATQGDPLQAAFAAGLAGACVGFLPFNLTKPARIFLGDGGSMPIGIALSALIMSIPGDLGWAALLASVPLVGLPILDTTLVVISRRRRRARVFEGGRDHLTHRLLRIFGSTRRVALVLAIVQGLLCTLAGLLFGLDKAQIAAAAALYIGIGGAVVLALESGGAERSATTDRGVHLLTEEPRA